VSAGITFKSVLERLERLENPYPGLRPFEPYQSHLFFGRDQHVAQLIDRLERSRFVAVVGVSGCGKSSLVRAGLIPSLERGLISAATGPCRIVVANPGGNPYANLSEALKVDSASLRKSSYGVLELARQLPDGERLVIFIDQFEELFQYRDEEPSTEQERQNQRQDAAETSEFVQLLLTSAAAQPPVCVVITMRSEYLGECDEFRGLPEVLNDSQYLVPRMSREQRRQAIEYPLGSVMIEASLVQRLLNDAGDEPDQLPILQHALMRIWSQWHKSDPTHTRPICLDDYAQIGGWDNAINQHATELMKGLSEDLIAAIFKRLTAKNRGRRERRDPATIPQLCAIAGASEDEVMKVIGRFNEATFLRRSGDLVNISHESLIRRWDKLVEWVKEEEKSRMTFLFLLTRSKGEPLQGLDLADAQEWNRLRNKTDAWAKHYAGRADLRKVLKFLQVSEAVEEKRRGDARRLFRMAVVTAVVFAVLFIVTLILGVQAARDRRSAKMGQLSAQALELVATSSLHLRQKQIEQAAIDAADSIWHLPGVQNDIALRAAMALLPRRLLRWELGGAVNGVVFSRDGKYLATASEDGTARVFDVDKEAEYSDCANKSPVKSVAFSPDGRFIATVSQDPGGHVCDVQLGHVRPGNNEVKFAGGAARVVAVAFSADGHYLARVGEDRTVRVFTVGLWNQAVQALVDKEPITALAFSPSGRYLATASGRTRIWDWKAGKSWELPSSGEINVLAFSADNRYLAAASDDRTAYVFDTQTRKVSRIVHQGKVTALAFNDKNEIVTGSDDTTARLSKAQNGEEVSDLGHQGKVDAVAARGQYIATGSLDGTSRVFRGSGGGEIFSTHYDGGVRAVALSYDGRRLATGSDDHYVSVFETNTRDEILRVPHVTPNDLVELASGELKLVVSGDGGVREFDPSGAAIPYPDLGNAISRLAVSPDGSLIATGSDDGHVRILNTRSGTLQHFEMGGDINDLEFSDDGKALVAASDDKTAGVYDASTNKLIRIRHRSGVTRAAFGRGNLFIVTASSDNTVHLFDRAGQPKNEHAYEQVITAVASGGSPPYLGIGIVGGVQLVDPKTFKSIVLGDTSTVNFLRFSGDFRHVLRADAGTVRHFGISIGDEVARIGVNGQIRAVDYSMDGRFALTAFQEQLSGDLVVVRDLLASQDLLKDFCHRIDGRELTSDSRQQYRRICSGIIK
jgi:WD40 repeat protein